MARVDTLRTDLSLALPSVETLISSWRSEAYEASASLLAAAASAASEAVNVAGDASDAPLARAAACAAVGVSRACGALAARCSSCSLTTAGAARAAEASAIDAGARAHRVAAALFAAQLEDSTLPSFDSVHWTHFRAASSKVELSPAAVVMRVSLQGLYHDLVVGDGATSQASLGSPAHSVASDESDGVRPQLVPVGDGRALFEHAAGASLTALAERYASVLPSYALLPTLCADLVSLVGFAAGAADTLGQWRGAVGSAWRATVARAHFLSCPLSELEAFIAGAAALSASVEADEWAWCAPLACQTLSASAPMRSFDVLRAAASASTAHDVLGVSSAGQGPESTDSSEHAEAWRQACAAASGGATRTDAEAVLAERHEAAKWDISTGGVAHWVDGADG